MNRKNPDLRTISVTHKKTTWSCEGLCVNCTHRETCTLPKARCGVLYCNEYE